jgi:hypothetical protein
MSKDESVWQRLKAQGGALPLLLNSPEETEKPQIFSMFQYTGFTIPMTPFKRSLRQAKGGKY